LVLALLLALTVVDWVSTVTALWFCFYALGNPIGIGTLLTGFSFGVTAGFISFVPGGLGVQEGSMAGIYALLNVPIRTAVLAAILFRVVYYFIPFLASLGVCPGNSSLILQNQCAYRRSVTGRFRKQFTRLVQAAF